MMEENQNLRVENDALRRELEILRQQVASKDSDYHDLVTQHSEALNLLSSHRRQLEDSCSAADGCEPNDLSEYIGRLNAENASILAENFEMSSNIYALEMKNEKQERLIEALSEKNGERQWQIVNELTKRIEDLERILDMLRAGTMTLKELCDMPKQTETKTTAEVFEKFSKKLRDDPKSKLDKCVAISTLPSWAQERIDRLELENREMCQCVPKIIRECEESASQLKDVMLALQGAYAQLDETRGRLHMTTEQYNATKKQLSRIKLSDAEERYHRYVDLVERVLTAGDTIECTVALVLIRTYSGQQEGDPYLAGPVQNLTTDQAGNQKPTESGNNESTSKDLDKNFDISNFFEEKAAPLTGAKGKSEVAEKVKEVEQPSNEVAVDVDQPDSAQKANVNVANNEIIYEIPTEVLVNQVGEVAQNDTQNELVMEDAGNQEKPPAVNVEGFESDDAVSETSSFEVVGEKSDESHSSSAESWDYCKSGVESD